jgi:hypothetical protein
VANVPGDITGRTAAMASPTQPREPGPSRGPTPEDTAAHTVPPAAGTHPAPTGTDHAPPLATDDASVADAVTGVVRSAVDALSKAGTVSAAALSDALESAGRSLSRRVVAGAATRRGMGDRDTLARALADRPHTPVLASATGAALAVKVVSRFKRLGFLAKKSPMWLVATAVPALAASVSRGADELGMVASHLIERALAAGVEPDQERVRRAAVQIVSHKPVDPETEPSHGGLALIWLKRAARAALPFTAGVATADPEGLAEAAASVDPALLGPA